MISGQVRPSVLSLGMMSVTKTMAMKPQCILDDIGSAFGVKTVNVDRTLELLLGRMEALCHLPYNNHSSNDNPSSYML